MGRVKDENLFLMIRNFLTVYLPDQRKSSPNTVKNYRIALDQYLTFLTKKYNSPFRSITFSMVNRDSVNDYLLWLTDEKHYSAATRNTRLASLKSFLNYASACRPEYLSILSELESIKSQKDDPFAKVSFMSEKAVKALLAAPDVQTKIGLRDQFFMILLYDTGGRIQEILDIRLCDLIIDKTPSVVLHGKGRKTRIVPLMTETIEHLKNYKKVFHPNEAWTSEEWLFYSDHVLRERTKLCDDTIRIRMDKYADIARKNCPDIPKKIHPHMWRHSRAMHLYQHGMDLSLVSQWLGHKQITTTLIYARADTEAKRKAIEKAMGKGSGPVARDLSQGITNEELIRRLYGLK